MASLRLYKDFYKMSITSEVYTPITPYSLSANSFVSGSTNVIETLNPIEESAGKYYVELNPIYYSSNNIYQINWITKYTELSTEKTLITKFKVIFQNYTLDLDYELFNGEYNIQADVDNVQIINCSIDLPQ